MLTRGTVVNIPDMTVRLSEALPSLPVVDALRLAANLHHAGLTLCPVGKPGGWCDRCATLYGDPEAHMCRSCGNALEPVSFALITDGQNQLSRGGENMSDPVTTDTEVDDDLDQDDEK